MNQIKENNMSMPGRKFIPAALAIKAMRDSGYRNTAYALAELIDNSVQANAENVEVICLEKTEMIKERSRTRMQYIGVLDNGDGMKPETLHLALQFGNGTHLDDRSGIGRFGMGLPNSSISQCRRVDIWTWQNGPDNAMHSYLDVGEIEEGKLEDVPEPKASSLPEEWRQRSHSIDTSGTLVLWSNFDEHRLTWRRARTTMQHTESIIGRMYRKFINDGHVSILLLAFRDENDEPEYCQPVRVNDPLYLMKNSSTPSPFDREAMFQNWGTGADHPEVIYYNGKEHTVTIRMSWAREETLPEDRSDRGSQAYGKHAAKNMGVSIVRERRELYLDPSWVISYDPTERWWGVEVEFPASLDEIFGVTNNKQDATIFSDMAQFDWQAEADPGESMSEYRERMEQEGDPRIHLLRIVNYIRSQLQEVRKRLRQQTAGRREKKERHEPSVEDLVTVKFEERAKQGHVTEADNKVFTEEDRKEFEKNLEVDKNYPKRDAEEISKAVFRRNRKVAFLYKSMEGYAFFNVEHQHGGLTSIVFNTNHPFYEHLIEILQPKIGSETDAELMDRINKASDTLWILFSAWARYEMEEVNQKTILSDTRQEWGKIARQFLSEKND